MKKEDKYKKSLRLLNQFLTETPKEELDAIIAECEAMRIEGPTLEEYFNILQEELQQYMKQFKT